MTVDSGVFPDNSGATGQSLRWLRLPLLTLLVVGGAGSAWWWKTAHTAPGAFIYVHGELPAPSAGIGDPVFAVVGPAGRRTFTLTQLKALPAVQYRAYQPQLKQSFTYTGVPLRDLATQAGLSGQDLRVTADDQFGATIPVQMYQGDPVMLAYLEDGHPISAAHKGPLTVVLPNRGAHLFEGEGAKWVWYATSLAAAP